VGWRTGFANVVCWEHGDRFTQPELPALIPVNSTPSKAAEVAFGRRPCPSLSSCHSASSRNRLSLVPCSLTAVDDGQEQSAAARWQVYVQFAARPHHRLASIPPAALAAARAPPTRRRRSSDPAVACRRSRCARVAGRALQISAPPVRPAHRVAARAGRVVSAAPRARPYRKSCSGKVPVWRNLSPAKGRMCDSQDHDSE